MIRHNYDPNGDYAKFQVYAKVSDMVNVAVLGMTAKELREAKKMVASDFVRDKIESPELNLIALIEQNARNLIDKRDIHPVEAMEEVISLAI